jgi:hypothetical protein
MYSEDAHKGILGVFLIVLYPFVFGGFWGGRGVGPLLPPPVGLLVVRLCVVMVTCSSHVCIQCTGKTDRAISQLLKTIGLNWCYCRLIP